MERRPLSEQEIQEIQERAQAAGNGAMPARLAIAHYLNDVDRLATEIERLRAELSLPHGSWCLDEHAAEPSLEEPSPKVDPSAFERAEREGLSDWDD